MTATFSLFPRKPHAQMQNDHPKLLELKESGIENESQRNAAFLVYMDLCEVRGWWNVQLHACQQLNLVFISGHSNRWCPRELVLPILSSDTISPAILQEYLHSVQLEDYQSHGITLAVCDSDSTTVYYKVSDGLVPPDSPQVTEKKKQQRAERFNKRRGQTMNCINKYMEKKSRLALESESRTNQGNETTPGVQQMDRNEEEEEEFAEEL